MPDIDQVDGFFSRFDLDLRDQPGVCALGEHRLNPVGLRAGTIDKSNVAAGFVPGILVIDVVVDVSEGGWEKHTVSAFDRHEMLTDNKGRRAVRGKVVVKLRDRVAHVFSLVSYGWCLMEKFTEKPMA